MSNLKLRLEVQNTIQQYVGNLMQQYNITATMMEDALKSVLLELKDLSTQELINSILEEQQKEEESEEEEDEKTTDN